MRNLISLIIRFSALVLFITLEILSFYLIVNYNKSQREIWAHSSNLFTGTINKYTQNVASFFDLQSVNDSLLVENAKLLETIINYRVTSKDNAFQSYENNDTIRQFEFIPARVCNKTLHLRNNFMTLCKGSKDGIKTGMGVISDNGIVGIVKAASSKYATVMLLTNSQSRIGSKVKSKNYTGSLKWYGPDPTIATLEEVPKHAAIAVGDTIISSGYSVSFPPDIPIGTILDYSVGEGSNNYNIKVSLDQDLAELDYVFVVNNIYREEKTETINTSDE